MILIFEDHWQYYEFNIKLRILKFATEQYDCFKNGISDISFHRQQSKDSVYVYTIIVDGKMHLNFSIKHNLPVWKVISDYSYLFEEMSKYNLCYMS